jgi:multiple sugar transport system permease protein
VIGSRRVDGIPRSLAENYEGWEWGRIGAAATMIMLPVVLFALAVRRYLIRGLTAGALKG